MGLFRIGIRIYFSAMILAAHMPAEPAQPVMDAARRLRRGEPEALEPIILQYQHRLFRFLWRILQDRAAAEDIFQETWVRVMEKIATYSEKYSFDAWLFSVARNLAIDYLRRKRPLSVDAPDDAERSLLERVAAAGADPLELALESERGAILAAAMVELPAIHREVLTLRFEEGMKLEEIAEVANIPISTVKSRLSRALDGLRRQVEAGSGQGGKQ